jgi:hypothetical protein
MDARHFFERVPNQVLEKPFDPSVVRAVVRRFVNAQETDVAV